jgi:hypothetical protein
MGTYHRDDLCDGLGFKCLYSGELNLKDTLFIELPDRHGDTAASSRIVTAS